MSLRAQKYNDSASGARSNVITRKGQALSLSYIDSSGKSKIVRFDGLEDNVLIDRKIAVVTSPKVKNQILRQSAALKENNMQGVWEVPDASQGKRALKMMQELKINNIQVRIKHE